MASGKIIEFISREEQNHLFFAGVMLPLARYIYSGRVDPETITRDELVDALHDVGKTQENAFEVQA